MIVNLNYGYCRTLLLEYIWLYQAPLFRAWGGRLRKVTQIEIVMAYKCHVILGFMYIDYHQLIFILQYWCQCKFESNPYFPISLFPYFPIWHKTQLFGEINPIPYFPKCIFYKNVTLYLISPNLISPFDIRPALRNSRMKWSTVLTLTKAYSKRNFENDTGRPVPSLF